MDDTGKGMVAEFVATFALIFIGAGAVILNANGQLDLTGVALAHGLTLAIMVSITAHISGGLVNPAVTIGLWVTGKLSSQKTVAFIVAQLLGAVAGGCCCASSSRGTSTRWRTAARPQLRRGWPSAEPS